MTKIMCEFHCLGPVKEKDRSPKVFVLVKGVQKVLVSDAERSCMDRYSKPSIMFREIDRTNFSERVVAQN